MTFEPPPVVGYWKCVNATCPELDKVKPAVTDFTTLPAPVICGVCGETCVTTAGP